MVLHSRHDGAWSLQRRECETFYDLRVFSLRKSTKLSKDSKFIAPNWRSGELEGICFRKCEFCSSRRCFFEMFYDFLAYFIPKRNWSWTGFVFAKRYLASNPRKTHYSGSELDEETEIGLQCNVEWSKSPNTARWHTDTDVSKRWLTSIGRAAKRFRFPDIKELPGSH